jgi:hypothetical protein
VFEKTIYKQSTFCIKVKPFKTSDWRMITDNNGNVKYFKHEYEAESFMYKLSHSPWSEYKIEKL